MALWIRLRKYELISVLQTRERCEIPVPPGFSGRAKRGIATNSIRKVCKKVITFQCWVYRSRRKRASNQDDSKSFTIKLQDSVYNTTHKIQKRQLRSECRQDINPNPNDLPLQSNGLPLNTICDGCFCGCAGSRGPTDILRQCRERVNYICPGIRRRP